jgi:hypothetical protein
MIVRCGWKWIGPRRTKNSRRLRWHGSPRTYPTFASSGLAVALWPRSHLGLDLMPAQARLVDEVLGPLDLGRLNPLDLNSAAPALFAFGTEEQRLRHFPPIVRNEEKWCQLVSEPGAGSDLASLATRAVRDGDVWMLTGQKVWTTWAHQSRFGLCLARTDPTMRQRLTGFVHRGVRAAMDQRAGQSDRQSRWNPMDLRYDGAPEARAAHARGIPRTTGPGARTAALFGEGSGKESFAESDPGLDVAQRRYLQRVVRAAGRAPIVVMDRFTTTEFARLDAKQEIRSTVLPPAATAILSDDIALTDLRPLRYVRSITAALSPFQARRFTSRFDVTVLNGYGQAEMGEVIGWTAADAKANPNKIRAIGRPHPNVVIRIDSPDTNGVGELLVRPPDHAVGYADGFVWIEGRLGDLINRGGNKIFPNEVEEVLLALPAVCEVAVVGHADDRLGQVPVAFLVLTGDVSDEELTAACRSQLAAYKVPTRFVRVDSLPRTEVGKVLRTELIG